MAAVQLYPFLVIRSLRLVRVCVLSILVPDAMHHLNVLIQQHSPRERLTECGAVPVRAKQAENTDYGPLV